MPYFSRMSVTFFKNGLKWLGYMYIKGFGVELASYQNFKSNMVSGKCGGQSGKKNAKLLQKGFGDISASICDALL